MQESGASMKEGLSFREVGLLSRKGQPSTNEGLFSVLRSRRNDRMFWRLFARIARFFATICKCLALFATTCDVFWARLTILWSPKSGTGYGLFQIFGQHALSPIAATSLMLRILEPREHEHHDLESS